MDASWRMSVQELMPLNYGIPDLAQVSKKGCHSPMILVCFQKNYYIPFLPMVPEAEKQPKRR